MPCTWTSCGQSSSAVPSVSPMPPTACWSSHWPTAGCARSAPPTATSPVVAAGALPLLDEALSEGRPATGRRDGAPALAVPVCDPAALALLLVRGQRLPFLEVEVRRVEALAALGGRLLAASGELSVVR